MIEYYLTIHLRTVEMAQYIKIFNDKLNNFWVGFLYPHSGKRKPLSRHCLSLSHAWSGMYMPALTHTLNTQATIIKYIKL